LLGPVGFNTSTARALAADSASNGSTSAAVTDPADPTAGSLVPPPPTPATGSPTDAPTGGESATTGDTAKTGSLEAPKEAKSKKRSGRSSTKKSKEPPAGNAEEPLKAQDDKGSSTAAPPSPTDSTGEQLTKPTEGTPSDAKPSEEKSSERKSSRSTSRKSKKSKAKESDTAGGATLNENKDGAGDLKTPGDTKTPAAEQPQEVKPPTGEQQQPEQTQDSQVQPPTASEAQDDSKTEGTENGGKTEVIKLKRTNSGDTASDTDDVTPAKKPKRASSLVEADELLLKNKFEAAEEAYRSLIPTDDTGDAYAGLAVALAKQMWPKKVIEAEKLVKKAKEQFEENPNILAAGGYVSYIHSKSVASPAKRDLYLEAAESLSKRAVRQSPDTVIAQQTLGLVKLAQDDPESAIPPLRKAAKMAEDPYTNTLLAEALLKVDPHDEDAKGLIDEALGADKNFHPARIQKAVYLTNKGKHEEGFTELLTVPRDQRGSDWHRVQGDIFRAQGDGPSALNSWKEANRLDPRNPEPYKQLAEYYAARGDGELAIAEMHNALEILPNDLRLRLQLAELALRQDKLDVAETEYRTILGVKDSDPQSLLGLSRVFFRKARKEGQYPTGWTELLDKVQRVVTEQSVQGNLVKSGAKNLTEKIQLSEAEKALSESPPRFRHARQLFSQVITTHREEPYELLSLGDQAYNDGDLKSAEEAFGYAKEINEVAPRAEQGISKIVNQRNEAKRHTELGNATWKLPEIAIDHYKQALLADPQHPDAYYGLYKLYFRLKKDDTKAIDYANNFLEASEDSDPLRKEVEEDLFRLKKRDRKDNSK
jgi:tetratricopeptide (TPR) repeat protein